MKRKGLVIAIVLVLGAVLGAIGAVKYDKTVRIVDSLGNVMSGTASGVTGLYDETVRVVDAAGNVLNSMGAATSGSGTLGDVTAGGPNGTLGQFSVNSVRNIKAPQYGASGSIQTMSCTAASGSSTLTGCAGGDFVVGNSIRIGSAGIGTSLAAPGTPTATCAAHGTGGVCSPSLVIATAGSCSAGSKILTLSNSAYASVEYGQTITVATAGTAGADLVTTVAQRSFGSATIVLAAACVGAVTNVNVTLGTVVYSYQIVTVDGNPNGALSAASSAGSSTQLSQAPALPTGATWVNTDTVVSWTAVTNARGYLVYKSINGGPSNFYTFTTGTSLTDYGTESFASFTCANLDVPCVAPASPVANDVFAKITGITGSCSTSCSVTIGALTYQPKYRNVPFGGASTYPSQPGQSNTFTVYHDDTQALQILYQELLPIGGHTKIEFPTGDYNMSEADAYGAQRALNILGLSDLLIDGDSWGGKVHFLTLRDPDPGSSFIWNFGGFATLNAPTSHAQARQAGGYNNRTTNGQFALVDPATAGSMCVRLVTPSDSANFAVGMYTTIWSTPDGTYPGYTYQTLMDQIVSLDSTQGIICLREPLVHTYSAGTLSLPYSESTHNNGPPWIMPMPYGPAAWNVTVRGLWFEGAGHFWNGDSSDNVTLYNNYIHSTGTLTSNIMSHINAINNYLIEEGDSLITGNFFGGTAGTRQVKAIGNTYIGQGFISPQSCQENSSDILWEGNSLYITGYSDTNSSLINFGGCYGFTAVNNTINITSSNMLAVIGWQGTGPWIGKITNSRIHLDRQRFVRVGVALPIQTTGISDLNYVSVEKNSWWVDDDTGNTPRDGFGTLATNPGSVNTLTYGPATAIPNLQLGVTQSVTVTDGVAWQLKNPFPNPVAGQVWYVDIFNNSGGVGGAITLDTWYKGDGTLAAPATGKRKRCTVTNISATLLEFGNCTADM